MRSPSDLVLLDVWDGAPSEGITSRALRLLGTGVPELRLAQLADLPSGLRDNDLPDRPEHGFGDTLACAHVWQAPIAPARFFLSEVDAWARRTLHEVHQLAWSYGWSEAQIVALSPRRRQYYLELSGG